MSLSPDKKRQQRELEREGQTGRNNSKVHALNVEENIDKSNAQLFRAADKHGPNSKAAHTLRARGINYP